MRLKVMESPCKGCEHYAAHDEFSAMGRCRHPNGPNGLVFASYFFPMHTEYPDDCPKDPNPPTPRLRPGMKRPKKKVPPPT